MDLHRHARASCRGRTRRSASARTQRFGGSLKGTRHAHRRPGRDGRRPTPRRHDERRRRPVRRGRPRADRAPHQDALPRPRDGRRSTRPFGGRRRRGPRGEAVSIGLLGNAAEVVPELLRRGFRADVVTDQTSAHDPLGGYVPAGLTLEEAAELRVERPRRVLSARLRVDGRSTSRRWSGSCEAGAVVFDYGNNLRAGAELGGLAHERAYAYPGVRAGVHPAAVLRGQGPVPLGGALGRSRRTSRDRPGGRRAVPRRRAPAALARAWPRSASRSRACRRASAGSATASATRPGSVQRAGRIGRGLGADRDRPRPPGRRQRRLAVPRDRGR